MKLQTVVLIVVVALLVFAVTFMAQFREAPPPSRPSGGGGGEVVAVSQIDFPAKVAYWAASDTGFGSEYETHVRGHFDFWFTNSGSKPVRMVMREKSCQCTDVSMAMAKGESVRMLVQAAAEDVLAGPLGLACILPAAHAQQLVYAAPNTGELDWKAVDISTEIPPGAGGWVRLGWKREQFGPVRLSADMLTEADSGSMVTRLEVPLVLYPAVAVMPKEPDVGVLRVGSEARHEFVLWSATREQFPVNVQNTGDPCVTLGEPKPLTDRERDAFYQQHKVRIRSGFKVPIIVREQVGDTRLDLGPFTRRIDIATVPEIDPLPVVVHGVVRGDFNVADNRDRVALGTFESDKGKTTTFTLTTDRGGQELEVAEVPDYLEAKIVDSKPTGSGHLWRLQVKVLPGRYQGELPPDCALVLTTKGDSPRRIRIPVSGNAYR